MVRDLTNSLTPDDTRETINTYASHLTEHGEAHVSIVDGRIDTDIGDGFYSSDKTAFDLVYDRLSACGMNRQQARAVVLQNASPEELEAMRKDPVSTVTPSEVVSRLLAEYHEDHHNHRTTPALGRATILSGPKVVIVTILVLFLMTVQVAFSHPVLLGTNEIFSGGVGQMVNNNVFWPCTISTMPVLNATHRICSTLPAPFTVPYQVDHTFPMPASRDASCSTTAKGLVYRSTLHEWGGDCSFLGANVSVSPKQCHSGYPPMNCLIKSAEKGPLSSRIHFKDSRLCQDGRYKTGPCVHLGLSAWNTLCAESSLQYSHSLDGVCEGTVRASNAVGTIATSKGECQIGRNSYLHFTSPRVHCVPSDPLVKKACSELRRCEMFISMIPSTVHLSTKTSLQSYSSEVSDCEYERPSGETIAVHKLVGYNYESYEHGEPDCANRCSAWNDTHGLRPLNFTCCGSFDNEDFDIDYQCSSRVTYKCHLADGLVSCSHGPAAVIGSGECDLNGVQSNLTTEFCHDAHPLHIPNTRTDMHGVICSCTPGAFHITRNICAPRKPDDIAAYTEMWEEQCNPGYCSGAYAVLPARCGRLIETKGAVFEIRSGGFKLYGRIHIREEAHFHSLSAEVRRDVCARAIACSRGDSLGWASDAAIGGAASLARTGIDASKKAASTVGDVLSFFRKLGPLTFANGASEEYAETYEDKRMTHLGVGWLCSQTGLPVGVFEHHLAFLSFLITILAPSTVLIGAAQHSHALAITVFCVLSVVRHYSAMLSVIMSVVFRILVWSCGKSAVSIRKHHYSRTRGSRALTSTAPTIQVRNANNTRTYYSTSFAAISHRVAPALANDEFICTTAYWVTAASLAAVELLLHGSLLRAACAVSTATLFYVLTLDQSTFNGTMSSTVILMVLLAGYGVETYNANHSGPDNYAWPEYSVPEHERPATLMIEKQLNGAAGEHTMGDDVVVKGGRIVKKTNGSKQKTAKPVKVQSIDTNTTGVLQSGKIVKVETGTAYNLQSLLIGTPLEDNERNVQGIMAMIKQTPKGLRRDWLCAALTHEQAMKPHDFAAVMNYVDSRQGWLTMLPEYFTLKALVYEEDTTNLEIFKEAKSWPGVSDDNRKALAQAILEVNHSRMIKQALPTVILSSPPKLTLAQKLGANSTTPLSAVADAKQKGPRFIIPTIKDPFKNACEVSSASDSDAESVDVGCPSVRTTNYRSNATLAGGMRASWVPLTHSVPIAMHQIAASLKSISAVSLVFILLPVVMYFMPDVIGAGATTFAAASAVTGAVIGAKPIAGGPGPDFEVRALAIADHAAGVGAGLTAASFSTWMYECIESKRVPTRALVLADMMAARCTNGSIWWEVLAISLCQAVAATQAEHPNFVSAINGLATFIGSTTLLSVIMYAAGAGGGQTDDSLTRPFVITIAYAQNALAPRGDDMRHGYDQAVKCIQPTRVHNLVVRDVLFNGGSWCFFGCLTSTLLARHTDCRANSMDLESVSVMMNCPTAHTLASGTTNCRATISSHTTNQGLNRRAVDKASPAMMRYAHVETSRIMNVAHISPLVQARA